MLGAGVVVTRASVAPTAPTQTENWASTSGFFAAPTTPNTQDYRSDTSQDSAPIQTRATPPTYVSPFATATAHPTTDSDTPIDLDSLLSTLSHPATHTNTSVHKSGNTYDLIPSGLISMSNLEVISPSMSDSVTQASLRQYANSVGTSIINFENNHPNQASTLKDHAEAPYDTSKIDALSHLGADYIALGDTISQIDPVPAALVSIHKRFVADYRDLGNKLIFVSKSPGNLYDAIVAYDASADQFAKDFVALALTFPAYNIRFLQAEPGSTFQFTGNGGL